MAVPTSRPSPEPGRSAPAPIGSGSVVGGRYRLGERLGRGGMADVFDGFDERLDRPVAVKVLRPGMATRPDVRRRFEVEARSAAKLSHPNVVSIYDTGDDDGFAWIVMERLPGETLADRVSAGPAEPDWLRRVAGDVLGALGAAHAAGIIHRDIKPGNILIGADGCAKVADFGIAKSIEIVDDTTHTGQLVGTPAYLAPERIDGEPATPSSDLYSLGVVLYEALAGTKPFSGTTPVSIAYAVRHTDPRPLHEVRPGLPPALVAAVHRAMTREPAGRFGSAADMRAAIERASEPDSEQTVFSSPADHTLVLEEVDQPIVLPPGSGASAAARHNRAAGRQSRTVVAVLVALLVALGLVGAALADNNEREGGLPADLRAAAAELAPADGPRSGDAAARLEALAAAHEASAGDQGQLANAFLAELATWQANGGLTAGAVSRLRPLVLQVPGADASAFAVATTAPPPLVDDGDGDEGAGKRKGGKKKDDDD